MASFRATSAYRLYFAELGTDPTMYLCPQAAPDGSSSGLRKTFRKVKKWSRNWSRAGQPSLTSPEPPTIGRLTLNLGLPAMAAQAVYNLSWDKGDYCKLIGSGDA